MSEPRILWLPDPAVVARSRMAAFRSWLAAQRGVIVADYDALWRWSVADLAGFWGAFADFAGVRFHAVPQRGAHRRVDARGTSGFRARR